MSVNYASIPAKCGEVNDARGSGGASSCSVRAGYRLYPELLESWGALNARHHHENTGQAPGIGIVDSRPRSILQQVREPGRAVVQPLAVM